MMLLQAGLARHGWESWQDDRNLRDCPSNFLIDAILEHLDPNLCIQYEDILKNLVRLIAGYEDELTAPIQENHAELLRYCEIKMWNIEPSYTGWKGTSTKSTGINKFYTKRFEESGLDIDTIVEFDEWAQSQRMEHESDPEVHDSSDDSDEDFENGHGGAGTGIMSQAQKTPKKGSRRFPDMHAPKAIPPTDPPTDSESEAMSEHGSDDDGSDIDSEEELAMESDSDSETRTKSESEQEMSMSTHESDGSIASQSDGDFDPDSSSHASTASSVPDDETHNKYSNVEFGGSPDLPPEINEVIESTTIGMLATKGASGR